MRWSEKDLDDDFEAQRKREKSLTVGYDEPHSTIYYEEHLISEAVPVRGRARHLRLDHHMTAPMWLSVSEPSEKTEQMIGPRVRTSASSRVPGRVWGPPWVCLCKDGRWLASEQGRGGVILGDLDHYLGTQSCYLDRPSPQSSSLALCPCRLHILKCQIRTCTTFWLLLASQYI